MKVPRYIYSMLMALFVICFATQTAYAEKYLVLLDSSDGMGDEVGGERILYVAVKEVIKLIDSLDPDSKVGVMVFGHTAEGCEDAELIIPFGKPDISNIREQLGKLSPSGRRGLIDSIEKALVQLEKESEERAVIFLVTSGWDECGGRDFLVEDAFKKSRIEVRLVIIAINPDIRDSDKLKDIATMGHGTYHQVENPVELGNLLAEIAKGTKAGLQVIMRGSDPDVPGAQLKVYDDKARVIFNQTIEGFFSTDLASGSYDIQLIYQGNSFWRRDVSVKKDESTQVVFDLDIAMGELRIEIMDSNNERMKGNVVVQDDLGQVVYEGSGQSEYSITVPPGTYSAEITVGSEVEYFDGIEVLEEGIAYFPAVFSVMMGTAEIVVNNADGVPVNASIVIEDSEGKQVASSDYTSTFLVNLPPGDYSAIVTTRADQQEVVPFYVPEGDNITVGVEVEALMGSILVRLVTAEGDAVYGRIRVYDERGREIPHFERESTEDSEFSFELPVGTYRIEAQVEDVIRTLDGVTVQEGEENIVDITFPEELT